MTDYTTKRVTEADRMIGNRLAAFRIAQGLSQTSLGNAIGVSYQQVQKYENGLNRIGAGRLQAISNLLKVPIKTFFADDGAAGVHEGDLRISYDDPQVLELVTAFLSITDDAARDSVLSIAKAAARLSAATST
jgi:transcriptional regulator with XRE-family HTH domain